MGAPGLERKAVKTVVRELYNATDSVDVIWHLGGSSKLQLPHWLSPMSLCTSS